MSDWIRLDPNGFEWTRMDSDGLEWTRVHLSCQESLEEALQMARRVGGSRREKILIIETLCSLLSSRFRLFWDCFRCNKRENSSKVISIFGFCIVRL